MREGEAMTKFTVTYEEISGWRENVTTVEADSVADALDWVEDYDGAPYSWIVQQIK